MSIALNNGPLHNMAPDVDDEEINLGELVGVVVENRWLIAATTIVALFLGAYKAYTEVPVYRADGLLQVEENSAGGMASSLDVTAMLDDYTPVAGEIEILKSRSVLGQVVKNLQLDLIAEPEYAPFIGEALARRMPADERPRIRVDSLELPDSMRGVLLRLEIIGENHYEIFDEEGGSVLRGSVGEQAVAALRDGGELKIFVTELQGDAGQGFFVYRIPEQSAVRSLQGSVSVSEQGEWSGILSLSVSGTDRQSVVQQVDEIADVYVLQNRARRSEEAEKTLDFLEEQLPAVEGAMESAEISLNAYRLEKGSIDLPLETQTILQTIVSLEGQINELRQQREKVILAFTPEHPAVIALDRQISQLRGELDGLNAQVRDLPNTQQELLGLIRDVEVTTALFTSLLNTQQELRVAKAGTVANVRVIDYAVMPTSPVSPNKTRIMALAVLLGGFVGVALAFARKALSSGVEDPDLIEKRVNVPVYATVAHSKTQDRLYRDMKSKKGKQAVLAIEAPGDPAIESLRNLRTALHFGMMDVKNNCVMIVGPSPSVGKSFISVNLAAVLASNDKKVLLIDGDLRRGHLHEYLGLPRENGLSEFISGDISIGDALHQSAIPGLALIPTGTLPPNPAELLMHQRFSNCLSVLQPRYDHIIIDSPPILAVTDAAIIGQMVGGALMALKAGQHPMREIEQAAKNLRQADVNLRGLLFNNVEATSYRYGAGRYHYSYSYK